MTDSQDQSQFIATTAKVLPFLAVLSTVLFPNGVSAHMLTTLYNFGAAGLRDGENPTGLAIDESGNLFGIAGGGRIHHACARSDCGTVYELKRGKVFKLVYRFCNDADCADGRGPGGTLIVDTSGDLYGVTGAGGIHNEGTVFELLRDGNKWSYRKLYDFCSQANCIDGAGPATGLTYAGAANGTLYDGASPLYGTAFGGTTGYGVAYQLTQTNGQWIESVLYSFCSQGGDSCTDGAGPSNNLVVDAQGNLFGTTVAGGTNHTEDFSSGAGVAFELSSNSGTWTESALYDFCAQDGCVDGASPSSALIQDPVGNLIGTTYFGGNSCAVAGHGGTTCGTLYMLSRNGGGWTESVLYAFCARSHCRDGAYPNGNLALDTYGDVFGATELGGNETSYGGGGVLFEFKGSAFQVLYRFCTLANCADGMYPLNGVLQNAAAELVGTTPFGGSSDAGTVFELKP